MDVDETVITRIALKGAVKEVADDMQTCIESLNNTVCNTKSKWQDRISKLHGNKYSSETEILKTKHEVAVYKLSRSNEAIIETNATRGSENHEKT